MKWLTGTETRSSTSEIIEEISETKTLRETLNLLDPVISKRNRMGVEHLNNKMLVVSEVHQYAASTSQLTVEAVAEFNRTCERKKRHFRLQTSETLFYKEMNLRDM